MSAPAARSVRLLQAAGLTSSFDRFVVGPLLLSVAADLGVSLSAVAVVASGYFLAYGAAQPFWGLCSDRMGRVRTMRLTLAGACLAGTASALASGLDALVLARVCTGACIAAVVPATLVWVGDAVPIADRQRTLTDLNAASALGITAATALGGVLAVTVSWRVALLLPALVAGVLAVVLRGLPEPPRAAGPAGGLLTVVRSRWALLVLGLALVEGGALLGFLTWFAPVLESGGTSPTAAGAVVALYGVGLLLCSRVVKRVAGSTGPPVLLGVGAAGLGVAYALLTLRSGPVAVGAAALVVGAAWAAMHSTMQTWATEVLPQARAATVSLFAAMLFVGSGAATWATAPLADAGRWGPLFAAGALLALLYGVAAVAGRRAWARRQPAPLRSG